jgi:hypothetical protein
MTILRGNDNAVLHLFRPFALPEAGHEACLSADVVSVGVSLPPTASGLPPPAYPEEFLRNPVFLRQHRGVEKRLIMVERPIREISWP